MKSWISYPLPRHLAARALALTLGLAAPTLVGCSADDDASSSLSTGGDTHVTPTERQTLRSRLELDGGNQHAGQEPIAGETPAAPQSEPQTAEVAALAADGQAEVIATGDVLGNGSIEVTQIPEDTRPLVLRVLGAGGEVQAQALVTTAADGSLLAPPVSAETSAEVEAFVALLADGSAANDIDVAGLESHITARMAASVSSGASLGAGVAAAQQAWLQVMTGLAADTQGAVDVAAAIEARHQAHVQLLTDLVAAADATDENEAWADYEASSTADVTAALGASLSAQATAASAAWAALQLKGSGEQSAALAASLMTSATYDQWELSAAGLASAETDAAFSTLHTAVLEARTSSELHAAAGELATSLSTSLGAVLAAKAESASELEAYLSAASTARAEFEASLAAATDATEVAEAYLQLRGALNAALAGVSLGNEATGVATALAGLSAVTLELSPIQVGVEATLEVAFSAGVWAQEGAAALAGSASAGIESAVLARLSSVGADGSLTAIASTAVAAGGAAHFEAVTLAEGTTYVVTGLDAQGDIVAAAPLAAGAAGAKQLAVTAGAELSAETLVQLHALQAGHSLSAAVVATVVSDASARAALAQGDLEALVQGALAAQAAFDSQSGLSTAALALATAGAHEAYLNALYAAGGAAAQADARAEAHATLEAALTATVTGGPKSPEPSALFAAVSASLTAAVASSVDSASPSALELVVNAEARVSAVSHTMASLAASLDSSATAAVEAATQAYIEGALAASTSAELTAEGSAYADAIVGGLAAEGALETMLVAEGGALTKASVEAALAAALTQGETFQAAVQSAISLGLSADALTQAIADAHAALDVAITTSLQAQLGVLVSPPTVALAATVTAEVVASFANAAPLY